MQSYETDSWVISVPGKKPEKMTLPLISAGIPNLGYLKFLAIPELPKYRSSGLAFNIIKNLLRIDPKVAKEINLDKIGYHAETDLLLPNTIKIVNYLEWQDLGLQRHPLLPNLRVARSVINQNIIWFGSLYNHYPKIDQPHDLIP